MQVRPATSWLFTLKHTAGEGWASCLRHFPATPSAAGFSPPLCQAGLSLLDHRALGHVTSLLWGK